LGRPGLSAEKFTMRIYNWPREGLAELGKALESGEWDVIIAEELNVAVHLNVIPLKDALAFIDKKPEHTELSLPGETHQRKLKRGPTL
jgi:cob(I)alamin adenosyltransferase